MTKIWIAVLLVCSSLCAQTPILVSHEVTGTENTGNSSFGTSPWTFNLSYPGPQLTGTLAGNCLGIVFSYADSLTVAGPTDNNSNVYVAGPSQHDTNHAQWLKMWVTPAAAGTQHIQFSITGRAAVTGIQAFAFEWANTSGCAIDTGGGANSDAVALTTTATDMIWDVAVVDDAITPGVGNIAAGTGFTLLSAQRTFGAISQWEPSAPAGSNGCSFSGFGDNAYVHICAAFKVAPGGTAPSGMYIAHLSNDLLPNPPVTIQFPSSGNLQVGLFSSINTLFTSSTSDSNGNSWSTPGSATECQSPDIGCAQVFYAANAKSSATEALTPALNGTPVSGYAAGTVILFDIAGAAASPFDNASGTDGNQTSPGSLSAGSYTPTTSNPEFVFNDTTYYYETSTGVSGGNSVFVQASDSWDANDNNHTPPSYLQNDEGKAVFSTTSTNPVTISYANTGQATGTPIGLWESAFAGFVASSSESGSGTSGSGGSTSGSGGSTTGSGGETSGSGGGSYHRYHFNGR